MIIRYFRNPKVDGCWCWWLMQHETWIGRGWCSFCSGVPAAWVQYSLKVSLLLHASAFEPLKIPNWDSWLNHVSPHKLPAQLVHGFAGQLWAFWRHIVPSSFDHCWTKDMCGWQGKFFTATLQNRVIRVCPILRCCFLHNSSRDSSSVKWHDVSVNLSLLWSSEGNFRARAWSPFSSYGPYLCLPQWKFFPAKTKNYLPQKRQ